jgi:hypothetical protein
MLKNYAQERGVLIWHSKPGVGRQMVVTKEGHEDVRRFWKTHNKSEK